MPSKYRVFSENQKITSKMRQNPLFPIPRLSEAFLKNTLPRPLPELRGQSIIFRQRADDLVRRPASQHMFLGRLEILPVFSLIAQGCKMGREAFNGTRKTLA